MKKRMASNATINQPRFPGVRSYPIALCEYFWALPVHIIKLLQKRQAWSARQEKKKILLLCVCQVFWVMPPMMVAALRLRPGK